jgi:hypothetical protein
MSVHSPESSGQAPGDPAGSILFGNGSRMAASQNYYTKGFSTGDTIILCKTKMRKRHWLPDVSGARKRYIND